jgi:hypothetical protein
VRNRENGRQMPFPAARMDIAARRKAPSHGKNTLSTM